MEKITVLLQCVRACAKACVNWVWQNRLSILLVMVGVALFAMLFLVMFDECVEDWVKMALGVGRKRDAVQFIGLGIAGVVAIAGAVAVSKRANAQVKNNELVEKGHIQERFKTAVEHLGSERETARVASFYEFYHLAVSNKDLRESILDILCAYLRQLTTSDEYKAKTGFNAVQENIEDQRMPWKQLSAEEYADKKRIDKEGQYVRPTEEVRNLLDVLFQSIDSQGEWIFAGYQSNLRGVFLAMAILEVKDMWRADLREADLRKANLQSANLGDADLQYANLQGAVLRNTNLKGANLQYAKLLDAKLQLVKLRDAGLYHTDLRGANMLAANLRNAYLHGANLQHACLDKASLQGAILHMANLREVTFQYANLQGADLQEADLREADLREVVNLETANLSKARIKGAKFPEGYEPPADVIYD